MARNIHDIRIVARNKTVELRRTLWQNFTKGDMEINFDYTIIANKIFPMGTDHQIIVSVEIFNMIGTKCENIAL